MTLGGYNADTEAINAGLKIIERGRNEFNVAEEELFQHITGEIELINKQSNYEGQISVNLRSNSADPIIKLSKIPKLDVIEINAHCRQNELVEAGCGQALLKDPEILYDLTSEVVKKSNKKVSVKIRANVTDVDDVKVAKAINDAGADYIHIDAMKPGYNCADYDIIKTIRDNVDLFIIGNNSIRDLKSARQMLLSGADGISIARAAIKGTIPFDLNLI